MTNLKSSLIILFVVLAVGLFLLLGRSTSVAPSSSSSKSVPAQVQQQQLQSPPPPQPSPVAAAAATTDAPHAPSGKCITYEERYHHCLNLQRTTNNNTVQLKLYFDALYAQQTKNNVENSLRARASQNIQQQQQQQQRREVVLLRMHRKDWPLDFWLFVCSFLIEASANGNRDAFLYTLDGHENSIPAEFSEFVRVHPETELARIFKTLPYSGGYMRGDLGAAIFLKQHPQYDFVWMIESDMRYVGSWDQFFTDSFQAAKASKNFVPTTPNNGEGDKGKDSDLIWWFPRVLNYGYDIKPENHWFFHLKTWFKHFDAIWDYAQAPVPENPAQELQNVYFYVERRTFYGKWKYMLNNTMWAISFAPGFGASRRLLLADYEAALNGDSNENQEAVMPLVAQFNGFKIASLAGLPQFPLQLYFGFQRKEKDGRGETAPVYKSWMRGRPPTARALKFNTFFMSQFRNKSCLENVVFHPVKY